MSENEKLQVALKEFLDLFDIQLPAPKPEEKNDVEIYGNYEEIVAKTQAKLDEYREKSEVLIAKTGMSKDELETYASNPNNFTNEQWEALNKFKEAIKEIKSRTYKFTEDPTLKKVVEKERKKQYHRFGKKKNWLPL